MALKSQIPGARIAPELTSSLHPAGTRCGSASSLPVHLARPTDAPHSRPQAATAGGLAWSSEPRASRKRRRRGWRAHRPGGSGSPSVNDRTGEAHAESIAGREGRFETGRTLLSDLGIRVLRDLLDRLALLERICKVKQLFNLFNGGCFGLNLFFANPQSHLTSILSL